MGEVSCYVRDGRLGISIPVVCVHVGGPQSIVYCNVSTSHSHHTGYPPCGESRGGCRWDTCRGRGWSLCRRRVGGGGGEACRHVPPLNQKKRKKRGLLWGQCGERVGFGPGRHSGRVPRRGQGGGRPFVHLRSRCPPPPRGGSSQDGIYICRKA